GRRGGCRRSEGGGRRGRRPIKGQIARRRPRTPPGLRAAAVAPAALPPSLKLRRTAVAVAEAGWRASPQLAESSGERRREGSGLREIGRIFGGRAQPQALNDAAFYPRPVV